MTDTMTPSIPSSLRAAGRDSAGNLLHLGLGVVAGVLLALTVAAMLNPTASTGRYQVSVGAAHAIIVDTVTGQAWEKYLPVNEGSTSPGFLDPKLKPNP